MKVNENKPMREDRAAMKEMAGEKAYCIERAGGEDPRRYDAQIMIDSKVRDHDISGYNHNGVQAPEVALGNNEHMAKMERRAMSMGTQNPDGTYSK